MTTILALDPGAVTGFAIGSFSVRTPLRFIEEGVLTNETDLHWLLNSTNQDITVAEKFVLSSGNQFVADLSGVRLEGLIEALRYDVVWRLRSTKTQVPDSVLKEHNIWITGKQVGWTDGRDVNDAIIHALGHVAFTMHHKPTLEKYFK